MSQISLDSYALLNVTTFLAQLANFAQQHTDFSGKSLAEFV